jgi:integrase/recombinase XerC
VGASRDSSGKRGRAGPSGHAESVVVPIEDASQIADYLQHIRVEKRLADRTGSLYAQHLDTLAHMAARVGVTLLAVEAHHIRSWAARLHAGGASPRSMALVLSSWRGFYAWLGRMGRVAFNPVADVRAPKSARLLPKALSVEDALRLMSPHGTADADPADPVGEARDRCMTELLYSSGLRLAELIGLDCTGAPPAVGWVDAEAAEVHVLGKGGKRRTVPVGQAALDALKDWMAQRHAWQGMAAQPGSPAHEDGARALFINRRGTRVSAQQVRAALRQRSRLAGLPVSVHPHMLRHSFASHVLQSSSDLRAVQELLGHANISTTQVYTRLDFQHLAKVYEATHPRAAKKPSR